MDGDGDGKRDLFSDLDDVFASVANYFAKKGQVGGRRPGDGAGDPRRHGGRLRQSRQCGDLDQTLSGLAAKGYRPATFRYLHPDGGPPVTLITLEGSAGPEYWIVYNNFKAITTYNISPVRDRGPPAGRGHRRRTPEAG